MILQENILPLVTQLNTRLNNKEEIMSQFTKSFLWRFILDIILHLIGMKIFLFDDDKQIAQDNINALKFIYDNNNLGVIYC